MSSASPQPNAFVDSDEDNASMETSDLKNGDVDSLDKSHDLPTEDDDTENDDDEVEDDDTGQSFYEIFGEKIPISWGLNSRCGWLPGVKGNYIKHWKTFEILYL